jgi:hypothetical protein
MTTATTAMAMMALVEAATIIPTDHRFMPLLEGKSERTSERARRHRLGQGIIEDLDSAW